MRRCYLTSVGALSAGALVLEEAPRSLCYVIAAREPAGPLGRRLRSLVDVHGDIVTKDGDDSGLDLVVGLGRDDASLPVDPHLTRWDDLQASAAVEQDKALRERCLERTLDSVVDVSTLRVVVLGEGLFHVDHVFELVTGRSPTDSDASHDCKPPR